MSTKCKDSSSFFIFNVPVPSLFLCCIDKPDIYIYVSFLAAGLGGWYSYRMAKCALNMATKNLSIELGRGKKKVICVALHPGTVNTDLSRLYHKGVPEGKLFSPEYSVQCQMNIIDNVDVKMTGKFFSWDGTELAY